MALDHYRLLGRSGLRVSPIALGTMGFGADWGSDEGLSHQIFDAYCDIGGNFIDTAGIYAGGQSEEMIGKFLGSRRDKLVISTKYSLSVTMGNPNAAGNGRKSMMESVEASLKRLSTDYIDLLFLHAWDDTTPADEIMRGFDDLIRQGKVLYIGVSDTPAWNVARMQTMAELRGWTQFTAMQLEYSLMERSSERELIPAARSLGLGVMPWGILRGGALTQAVSGKPGSGRLKTVDPARQKNEKTQQIAAIVREISSETDASPAQIAIAWTLANPAVVAPISGARTIDQIHGVIDSLQVQLSDDQLERLGTASQIEPGFPHNLLTTKALRAALTGATAVSAR